VWRGDDQRAERQIAVTGMRGSRHMTEIFRREDAGERHLRDAIDIGPDDDLLDPRWAQCLSEICITDYPSEKIKLVAGDFVGVLSLPRLMLRSQAERRHRRALCIAAGLRWRSGYLSD
jgi:hypothetical protein